MLPDLDIKDPGGGGAWGWGSADVLSEDPAEEMPVDCLDTGSVERAVTHLRL